MESNSPSSERNLFGRTSRVPNLLPEIFSDSQLLNFTVFRHNKKLIWFLCFLFAKIFIDKLLCAIRLLKFIVIIKVLRYYVQTPATSENWQQFGLQSLSPKLTSSTFLLDSRHSTYELDAQTWKLNFWSRQQPFGTCQFLIAIHFLFASTEDSHAPRARLIQRFDGHESWRLPGRQTVFHW